MSDTFERFKNGNLLDIFLATTEDRLSKIKISKYNMNIVCVVLGSIGYPEKLQKE